jgi:hypothetical protein
MKAAEFVVSQNGCGVISLKPDVMSEVILLGAAVLVFAILVLILIVVLTQAPAPI